MQRTDQAEDEGDFARAMQSVGRRNLAGLGGLDGINEAVLWVDVMERWNG